MCSVAALLLLHSIQGADPLVDSLQEGKPQVHASLPVGLVEEMNSLTITPLAEDMSTLVRLRRILNCQLPDTPPSDSLELLKALNALLAERREAAGDDSELIYKHYNDAKVILAECPVIPGADKVVDNAFSKT